MARRRDNAYSRLVFWLKILLPLAALAILSTMFLIARTIDPSRAIPFAKVDVRSLARQPRITEPHYTSVTSDGSSLKIIAAVAMPEPQRPGHSSGDKVIATLTSPKGRVAVLHADHAEIDQPADLATFTGHARVDTSDGYTVQAPRMTSALRKTEVTAVDGVTTTAPFGDITSRTMHLTTDPRDANAYVLVFKGDVKLVYTPGKKG